MTYDFSTTIEIDVEDLIDDMTPRERSEMFDVLREKLGKDADMELVAEERDARDDDPRERAIDFSAIWTYTGNARFLWMRFTCRPRSWRMRCARNLNQSSRQDERRIASDGAPIPCAS